MAFNYYTPTYKEFYYFSKGEPTYSPQNVLLENIEVYPNPVRDHLTIENNSAAWQLANKIFNINGAVLDVGVVINVSGRIDLSTFPPVFYCFKLYSRDKNNLLRTMKVMKL